MNQLAIFINLFFVPLLPLIVVYREKRKPLEPNLDLLFQYGIIAACNIPLTKVSIVLFREMVGRSITMDSGYYTLAAFLPTILAYSWYKFYKTYPDHDPLKERIVQKGVKGVLRDLAPAGILLFVGCFMLFLFEPILMYATNKNDVWFDFQMMVWPVLSVFVNFFIIGIGVVLAIYAIDLLISKRLLLYKGFILLGFTGFFLVYLQGNWLAGNLPMLEGEEIKWESYGKYENIALILAVIILAMAMIILIRKRGLNRTVFYAITCTSFVFVMLIGSLVPTVIINKVFQPKDIFSPTMENFNMISSNKNLLIFLVDYTDSEVFYNVMEEDDDFRGMLDDFTYFPDTLSVYPQTRDSIPNILTGTIYRNETNFLDYSSNAYNQSLLFEKLAQNGYSINLYSTEVAWEGERNYNIENSAVLHDDSIDKNIFMRQELKYILFKYMPYGLKQYSKIETLDFDECRIANSEYAAYVWGNKTNYTYMTEHGTLEKQDQDYFQYFHVEGSHNPLNMDKNLNSVKNATYEQKVGASLTMIKTYLERLKDNDAYDNSAIVVMADHGRAFVSGQPEQQISRCNPILFIKGINEKHDEMPKSDRPVSYVDLQDAFCDLIDGKQSAELFAGLKQGRTRTVIYQTTKTVHHKVEYVTTGKAWELDRFAPTGNVYDLEG